MTISSVTTATAAVLATTAIIAPTASPPAEIAVTAIAITEV